MNFVRNILPAAAFAIAAVGFAVCNGSYTPAPSRLPTALHPVAPRSSDVYHGESFRYPFGACDQPQCHGDDLKGGNSGSPSCWRCHGDLWMIFLTHTLVISGAYHNAIVDTASQRSELYSLCGGGECHNADLAGAAGWGPNCFGCHDPLPMPGHRIDYDSHWHRIGVQNGGIDNGICAVSGCHGDPGRQGPYCLSCHTGSTHSLNIAGYMHNPLVDTVTWNTELPPLCGNSWCHGSALAGGTGTAPGCLKCHNPIPTPGHRINYEGRWHKVGVQEGGANANCNVAGCHADPLHKGPYCTQCHDSSSGGVTMRRSLFIAVIITALASWYSCALVHSGPELNDFTRQCTHCHGERLEGIRNTARRCSDCHELKPIAASEVTSKIRRDVIMSEPHVHKAKNMFGGTPSCFNCHRYGSI